MKKMATTDYMKTIATGLEYAVKTINLTDAGDTLEISEGDKNVLETTDHSAAIQQKTYLDENSSTISNNLSSKLKTPARGVFIV